MFSSISVWVLDKHTKDPVVRPKAGATGEADDTQATGNDLPQVFASSDHLLCILRYLGDATPTTTPSPPPTLSAPGSSTYDSSSTCFEIDTDAASRTIVYNLVLACASQLLNLYLMVLDAVERNMDALETTPLDRAKAKGLHEPVPDMDSDMRTHLQHVSVVQLCSYFVRRQIRTMDEVVLNPEIPHVNSGTSDGQGPSFAIVTMIDLQTEVEDSLKRLQGKLGIY
jgi:hypothetical protein